jgi:2-polyprenyl-3-methyl-5-hydroxy-6-metoxy-1,4-benzoquinol methylase
MFNKLEAINARPKPFEFYTASELWTDEHISQQMLALHLNEHVDAASRNAAFIDRSVGWIASHFDIDRGKRVADFGCGPGLYATRLAQRGACVTGIDFSKRSIEYGREVARRKGLPITFVHQDYLEFTTEDRFDLILMIMCDFCALSPAQRRTLLRTFHTLLVPDGAVLFDVYSLAAYRERQEAATYGPNLLNGFWSPQKYYGFLNTFKYDEEKLVLDKYTLVEATRTWTIYNWFQHFTPEALERELVESGLVVQSFYSDVAGSPYSPASREFAVVARKMEGEETAMRVESDGNRD